MCAPSTAKPPCRFFTARSFSLRTSRPRTHVLHKGFSNSLGVTILFDFTCAKTLS